MIQHMRRQRSDGMLHLRVVHRVGVGDLSLAGSVQSMLLALEKRLNACVLGSHPLHMLLLLLLM
jgi:hypothetical protein